MPPNDQALGIPTEAEMPIRFLQRATLHRILEEYGAIEVVVQVVRWLELKQMQNPLNAGEFDTDIENLLFAVQGMNGGVG